MRTSRLLDDFRSVVAIAIGFSLIFSIVAVIIPQQNVLADKNDNGKAKSKNSDKDEHKAKKRWIHFVEKSAKEKHKENLAKHGPSGSYPHDTEYTLTATGAATPISGGDGSETAEISMVLSIWKSTKGLVAMDIMDGTVKIGDDKRDIYSGHVFYLIRGGHLLVFAFIVEDDDSGGQDRHISLLKLWAKTQKGDSLPLSDSDSPLKLDILSPQSKLISEYFLDMDGQLTFGGSGDDDNEPIPQPSKGAEIVTSADKHGNKFFGIGALQVVISDKNAGDDEITVTIKAEGDDASDTASITIPDTKAGSKKFEFFIVHADADCDDGSCIEKPLTEGSLDDEQVVTFGNGGELDTANEEFDEMSFTITYGDKKVDIEHIETEGSIELDRATYGSGSMMHLFINDQDANLDPTAVDSFVVQDNNVDELLTLDEEISLPDDIEFTETANNTARFEAVLQINDENTDEEAEIVIDEGTGPFMIELLDVANYKDLESDANDSIEIDSISINMDDKDGSIVTGAGDITFSSELGLTIRDNDQNKDSSKVDMLKGTLIVEIEGGDSEELDLRETAANSGEFAIDNADKQLKLTFAVADAPEDDNGLLEFTADEIDDDIVITYSDPLNEDGEDEDIRLELQLTTKEGSIELPSSADMDGDLTVTINDADLNDDPKAKESYTFTLDGDEPVPLEKDDTDLQDYAAIEVRFNDDSTDFDDAKTYTLAETGENTGVFRVAIDIAELAESAGFDSLEAGDTIEFTYFDRMEEPDEEDSDSVELDS